MSRRLPARVYWFRRALVLVVIAAAILGVRAAFPGGAEPTAADDDITAAEPPEQISPPTSPPASERSTGAKRKKAEPSRLPELRTVTAEFGTAAGPCTPEQTRVRPEVVGEPYSGSGVAIQLRVSTTAASSCTLRLTADELLVQISDSDRALWTSQECPEAVPDVTVVLHPYWTASVSLPWSGTRSNRRCDSEAVLDPGTYTVQAAILGGQPGDSPMEVIAAPRTTATTPPPEQDEDEGRQDDDQT